MTTAQRFPRPKDPADASWYSIAFPDALAAVLDVGVMVTQADGGFEEGWPTPGDAPSFTPLSVLVPQISADGYGAAFRLEGGIPGVSYALTATVQTKSGNTLRRSAILLVTGQ